MSILVAFGVGLFGAMACTKGMVALLDWNFERHARRERLRRRLQS